MLELLRSVPTRLLWILGWAYQVSGSKSTYAGLHAGNVVPHWVDAGLRGVYLNDRLQFLLAPLEFLLPVGAQGFAVVHDDGLGVHAPV